MWIFLKASIGIPDDDSAEHVAQLLLDNWVFEAKQDSKLEVGSTPDTRHKRSLSPCLCQQLYPPPPRLLGLLAWSRLL